MTPPPTGQQRAEGERRRTRGLAVLHQVELPLAVIAVPGLAPLLTNAQWSHLFARGEAAPLARLPAHVVEQLSRIAEEPARWFPELALDAGGVPSFASVVVRPLHDAEGAIAGAVLVGYDATAEVLARKLGVGADVLVWSGAVGKEADYHAEVARLFGVGMCGEPADSAEIQVRIGQAADRWYRVWFVVEGTRWYGLARDIDDAHRAGVERDELTARERAARADAERANHLKDQFLATVSHELRAPLTTMLLWETLLREGGDSEALRQRALEVIRFSVQTQSRIVGDLLDVSRAVSGKLFVDLRPVAIATVVEDAVTAARPAAEARAVSLTVVAAPELGNVEADAPRLRQVLANLLSNAIKFTEPGGRVHVSLTRRAHAIAIAVDDDGRGIAPEFLPRLFEPFAQMDAARDRYAGGLGLGLAIAKQLVELHHGTLVAASAGIGHGATFTVTLPVLPARRAHAASLATTEMHRLEGIRMLVVDDDARVRDALALLLARAGAAVRTADSAQSARARLTEERPDVLVCDIAMPVEDGYSLIRDLRAHGVATPAVAVTAHASATAAARALDAGFDRHLAKPIDMDHLIGCLQELASMSGR